VKNSTPPPCGITRHNDEEKICFIITIPLPILKRGGGTEIRLRNVTSQSEVRRPEK
jgi:hypothetical protein